MAKCSQCGKPAIISIDGVPLCVDCNLKFEQAQQIEFIRNATILNNLSAEMEVATGLPGLCPRIEIPKPTPFHQGPVTFNNIKADSSVIGSINTGQVKQIDVAMDNIKAGGNEPLVDSLAKFTEAVLAEKELETKLRGELIEQLSFVAFQCASPKQARKPSIVNAVLQEIDKVAMKVASLAPLWTPLLPLLQRAFS